MVSIVDDFNRADGALGANYTVPTGASTIEGNRAKVPAASGSYTIAYRNDALTIDDCTVSMVISPNGMASGARPGVVLRGDGTAGNYYRVTMKGGLYGGIYIYRVVASSATLVRTVPGAGGENIDTSLSHTLEVQVTGTTEARFIVKLNGVQKDDWTDSDPAAITAPGQAGWVVTGASNDIFFDDLSIVEGNATPAVAIAESDATVMCALGETTYSYSFNATATDPEDGDLTASISWEYRTDGGAWTAMGTGGTASQALPIGVNEVRASATDTNTATGTDTITITVQAYAFGGTVPAAGGFIAGDAGAGHTADQYTGDGVRVMITQQPSNGRIFVKHDGSLLFIANAPGETQATFKYRIQDQGGFSNEATITIDASASPIFPLDWTPEDAAAFGYLHLATQAPDYQAFAQTLSTSDTAANNIYLALRDAGLTTNTVAVGASDIIAFGYEIADHTGATADINTGGVFMSCGALWSGGAASFRIDNKVASSANRELVHQAFASYTSGFSDANSQGDLGSFTHKVVIYFNGATGKIGWGYYNHFSGQWVDKGYDPASGTFSSPITPFVSIDNDSIPVPALDGATISGSLKTDTAWLADAASILPAGSKAVDGTVI